MICMLLAALLLLGLCGCKSVFEKEYYYEAPYASDFGTRSDRATEIRNYNMLKTALTNMIVNHTERGEFRFANYYGSLSEDLAAACFEIKSDHPLGAYAVETLSYDTSYVVSYYVANIYISYKRSAKELQEIVYTSAVADLEADVLAALDAFAPELVIRCFAPGVDAAYIKKLAQRHYYDDPVTAVVEPEVEVTCYPADIANCIYEISFRYGLAPQRRMPMAVALAAQIDEAAAKMQETELPKLALECAVFLSEACAGSGANTAYADTAYGALVNRSANSKGLALAYRALCGALGIECMVVEGVSGGVAAEKHFWNIVALDGAYYHVDVSGMAEDPTAAFALSDDALWGRYIWEAADYPACDGTLTYAEVAELPEEGGEEDGEEDGEESPENTEQPGAPDGAEAEEPGPAQQGDGDLPDGDGDATPDPQDGSGAEAENSEKIP